MIARLAVVDRKAEFVSKRQYRDRRGQTKAAIWLELIYRRQCWQRIKVRSTPRPKAKPDHRHHGRLPKDGQMGTKVNEDCL